jgi:hypothetical protein
VRKATIVVIVAVSGFIAAKVWIQKEIDAHRSPTVTKEVANFKETLDPAVGTVHVRVFDIEKESTGLFDAQEIRASRVELEGPAAQVLSLPFETHQVRSADLDRNGTKELLLYREEGDVGVVWLHEPKLEFRWE